MLKQQWSERTERLPVVWAGHHHHHHHDRLLAGPVFAGICGLCTFITPCEWHKYTSDESD